MYNPRRKESVYFWNWRLNLSLLTPWRRMWEWSYRRWRWVVSLTPRPFKPPNNHWMVDWVPESIWTFTREESLLFLPVIESRYSVSLVKNSIKVAKFRIELQCHLGRKRRVSVCIPTVADSMNNHATYTMTRKCTSYSWKNLTEHLVIEHMSSGVIP
jgi:hypothetical protein